MGGSWKGIGRDPRRVERGWEGPRRVKRGWEGPERSQNGLGGSGKVIERIEVD